MISLSLARPNVRTRQYYYYYCCCCYYYGPKPLYQSGVWCTTIHVNKIYFHIKGWEPRLALRKRLQVIRKRPIESLHSLSQHTCKFIQTKESVYIRKDFNSRRIGLVHQHSRRLIVLEQQYGCHSVMWEPSIQRFIFVLASLGRIYPMQRKKICPSFEISKNNFFIFFLC